MAVILGQGAFFDNSNAQGSAIRNPEIDNQIAEGVYNLAQLADEMSFKYQWELGFNSACKDSLALLKRLRIHAALTDDLVRAFRSKSDQSFRRIACEVKDSVVGIENLSKRSRVSGVVSEMINQASHKAAFVHAHSNCFNTTASRNGIRIEKNG